LFSLDQIYTEEQVSITL